MDKNTWVRSISVDMTLLQALVRFCNHLQQLVRAGAHLWAHACI